MLKQVFHIKSLVRFLAFLLTTILIILVFVPFYTLAQEKREVIRVGYPIQKGLTEFTNTGYSGFTYEYLMAVAQYTDWEYEFVCVDGDLDTQLNTCLDMLSKGEIDLLGGLVLNDTLAQKYDYTSTNYGIASSVLCVLQENTKFNSDNYFTFPNMRVAVLEGATNTNKNLEQFCEMGGFEIQQIPFETEAEEVNALKSGEVDALLAIDINLPSEELRTIASFMPRPFYFAATKGKKDIVNQLSAAISRIDEANPYFTASLREKHFPRGNTHFYLTQEEKEFVANSNPIRVAMMGGKAPIQYRNPITGEPVGLSKDLLEHISEQSGLRFEITFADTYEQYEKLIKNGEIEIITGISNDYRISENRGYSLTIPYLSAPLLIVINNSIDPSQLEGKQLALSQGVEYNGDYQGEIVYFDSIDKCLRAVNDGDMDYCYGNSYSIHYYMSNPAYKNMLTVSRPDEWTQNFCFGVKASMDSNLLSILNKSIRDLQHNDFIQNSLYANTYEHGKITLFSYVQENPIQTTLLVLLIIMGLTLFLLLWNVHTGKKNESIRSLQNQRYTQLSELSNEFLYEYDIERDCLHLSAKCSAFLGCKAIVDAMKTTLPQEDNQSLFSHIVTMLEGCREVQCTLPNGTTHWMRIISKQVSDSTGTAIYSVGKLADIQQEKEMQEELRNKASKDSLTGLYNVAATRQAVLDILENSSGAMMVVDIDHFKDINDTFGHYVGDQALQCLAKTFQDIFRKDDVIGRIGGDEFVIFMKNASTDDLVKEKCDLLKQKVANLKSTLIPNITLSIGVAFAHIGQDYNELYQNADAALYEVKRSTRNGFFISRF